MGEAARQLPLWQEHRFSWSAGERAVWRRPRRQAVTEWAEGAVKLPPSVTSMAGYFRCALTPYLREVMDCWSAPGLRRVVFCAGPQTGKTLSAYLPLLYAMARDPGPALLVMSSQDGAKKVFKDYLTPILVESPTLRRLLSGDPDDVAAHRIRLANGMRLYGAWATSPALLKTFPARFGIGDEVDDWPAGAGVGKDAGDPEALFDVRLRTFPYTSKLVLVSSPGTPAGIWAKLAACQEVRVYLAKCPECGREQRMVWGARGQPGGFVFDSARDPSEIEGERLAAYACAGCGSHWQDADRDKAVRTGRWAAVDPAWFADPAHADDPTPPPPVQRSARPISVGFHLPAWYSRLVPLAKVVADFLRAHREPDPAARAQKLKAWRNNYPALPWEETAAAPMAVAGVLRLRDERPVGLVPAAALGLILTADVQGDGIWYEVRAWAADKTSWLIRHGFLPAALGGDWAALEQLLEAPYRDADGRELRIRFGLVDAGYRTDEVYEWCRRVRRVSPSKGYETRRTPLGYARVDVLPGTGKLIPGGLQRVDVDVTYYKDALAARLHTTPGDPGAWVLHAEADEGYARQYTSEAKDPATGKWAQRGRQPNHLWDCGVLQLAAAAVLETQGTWAKLAAERRAERAPTDKPPRPKRSGFAQSWR